VGSQVRLCPPWNLVNCLSIPLPYDPRFRACRLGIYAGEMPSHESKRTNARAALDPLVIESSSSTGAGMSRLDFVSKAIMAPFNHRKTDSTKILADRAL